MVGFLPSGMMTVFLFARLWKRSNLLTDDAICRAFAAKPATRLRGLQALKIDAVLLPVPRLGMTMTSIVRSVLWPERKEA